MTHTAHALHFNPRSLAGATRRWAAMTILATISIHAPSRERPPFRPCYNHTHIFQSTLPRGSDPDQVLDDVQDLNFNPRSLAGATVFDYIAVRSCDISIHAPSRERPRRRKKASASALFQSTLPRGSDQQA